MYREKAIAWVIEHSNFTGEYKKKLMLFTDVFSTLIVKEVIQQDIHVPFKTNIGWYYLENLNYAAVYSFKNHVALNKPFSCALNFSKGKNEKTPSPIRLNFDFDIVKSKFEGFTEYQDEMFYKDTVEVLDMSAFRYTWRYLDKSRKTTFREFFQLVKIGNLRLEEIEWGKKGFVISFDTYLGYFFTSNIITGNLVEY